MENQGTPTHMPTHKLTENIILAAIEGFEVQKQKLDTEIAALRAMLPGSPAESATPETPTGKRKISAAARRRMALGQKARWAKLKGESEPSTPATPEIAKPKRNLSAAGRKAISDATKKRWAAVHAAEQAKKPPLKKAAAKKKLSPARMAALVANLAKAREAKAAKAAAGAQ
jgi:hypothetical protein